MGHEYLFISDCHLDATRAAVGARLIEFMQQRAPRAHRLYILGDLFEVWLGDDDPAGAYEDVITALGQLAGSAEIFFIAGNRDFLLGHDFADRVGLTLLEEPEILQLGAARVALIHGDTLCTDDHDYQAFRDLVRTPAWQAEFLAKPLAERKQIAARLRSDSVDAMKQKSQTIMDVNAQTVAGCFQRLEADVIVHGHTHRPAVHRYADGRLRYVLGDWNPGPSYLIWNATDGFRLVDPRV